MRQPLPVRIAVQVTEVGWNLAGVSLQDQAQYLAQELAINEALGIQATYIYAGLCGPPELDFGLFHPDLTPRPSAEAVRQFQAARGMG